MANILLIDDDEELSGLLTEYLDGEGFQVSRSDDGAKILELIAGGNIDLVVLDIMMPRMNGLDVLTLLRKESDIPVIMLTARGDEQDRIAGLDLGADDYVPKPCSPGELAARIKAILRRSTRVDRSDVLQSGNLVLQPAARSAILAGNSLQLTGTEFSLLEILVRHAGSIVSKNEISISVFAKPATSFDRRIDVHLSSVRQKLGQRADGSSWIQSVRGQGYILLVE
ncbi:response regulator transcription factor [Allorhizobium undicola]|uniref:response regulator transcription factor n=1 Tax=Allorhizobium undicola TaxID=78527 RepID=UPI000480A8FE|nr:response regulator transcription factor [Allorhizobium undicola]